MKKIITSLFFIIISMLWITNANEFFIEGNNNVNLNVKQINKELNNLENTYWINLNMIFLDHDKNKCYSNQGYSSCAIKYYPSNADAVFVINYSVHKMESNIKHIYYNILNSFQLKWFQDNIIPFFKKKEYNKWILYYINEINNYMKNKCNSLKNNNFKIKVSDCKIQTLLKISSEINKKKAKQEKIERAKQEAQMEKERIILAKKKAIEIKKQNEEMKKQNEEFKKTIKIILSAIILIWILIWLFKYIQKKIAIKNLKNIIKDAKYNKVVVENYKNILENDRKYYVGEYKNIISEINDILWKYYLWKELVKKVKEYKDKVSKLQKDFQNTKTNTKKWMKEVEDKIEEVKKYDI